MIWPPSLPGGFAPPPDRRRPPTVCISSMSSTGARSAGILPGVPRASRPQRVPNRPALHCEADCSLQLIYTVPAMPTELQPAISRIASVNPATGEVLGELDCAGPTEVRAAVARARTAQPDWN